MTPSTQRQGGSMMSKWPDLVRVRYFGDACAIVDIDWAYQLGFADGCLPGEAAEQHSQRGGE